MNEIDIVMDWDGITPTAELIINGMGATGEPKDIQRMFDAVCDVRNRLLSVETQLDRIRQALEWAER